MAELTPEEREKIYAEEKARIEAREQIEAKKKPKKIGCGTGLLILFGIVVVFYVVSSFSRSSRPTPQTTSRPAARQNVTITPERQKMMQDMIDAKIVDKVNAEMNSVWVDPSSWSRMKYEDKERVGRFLAEWCGAKKGTGLNWVDIFDVYSGKKLAAYSQSWGFKVY